MQDQALRESIDVVMASFPDGSVTLDSWSTDRSKILYHVFDGWSVDHWVIHNRTAETLSVLQYARADIPKSAVAGVYSIEYIARDGLTIPAILTVPPGMELSSELNLPTIILPHGGPASYDDIQFDWWAQYFANRGYLILQPNFRGSSGFGAAFQTAGNGEWGKAMQNDITDGVEQMILAGFSDEDRICIMGASYGGYAALAGGAYTPDLYKCIVAVAPVTDLNDMLVEEKRQHGSNHWVVDYWEEAMANGEVSRSALQAISPARSAETFQAPVLLIHGKDDTTVRITQSYKMEDALEDAGKSVEFIKLDDGDHWMTRGENRLATLKAIDAFMAKYNPVDQASVTSTTAADAGTGD